MKFILSIFLVIFSLVGGLALSGLSIMVVAGFLHDNWWEAIPAVSFWPAVALGGILSVVSVGTNIINVGKTAELHARIFYFVFALLVYPFLMPFLVGWLNDEVFTSMPDISYGSTFMFTLLGLSFGIVGSFFAWVVEVVSTAISES